MKDIHPTALIILDGFGYRKNKKYNAIACANTPNITQWLATYPHTFLHASGRSVGLPTGYIGNSEVGHLTIGAGRIIMQPLTQILNAIDNKTFFTNHTLTEKLSLFRHNGHALHIMGLLSNAGIHCHEKIIYAFIIAALNANIKKIFLHLFLDGRDCPPRSAGKYIQNLINFLKHADPDHKVTIGSLHGRFYAMDRDKNWERTEKSYQILTEPVRPAMSVEALAKMEAVEGLYERENYFDLKEILKENYKKNITDEFISPTQLAPESYIKNGDGIIFCNIRPDRARQLTASFVDPDFNHFTTKPLQLSFFITPISYENNLHTTILFPQPIIHNTLKDILAQNNKTIFSIAETEKYAHVTYFFRGENEIPVKTEERVLIPSHKAKDYVKHPEMSAQKITDAVIASLKTNPKDFYLINYANADMVGHSGNFDATVKAVECLDAQLKQLYDILITQMNGTMYITADHGKAEDMYDSKNHQPRTAHTTNPVPFIIINQQLQKNNQTVSLSQLSDIAPFILQNMELLKSI